MFGIYRFILASIVVFVHVWRIGFTAGGYAAVFSFYVISGYLMTLILNEQYGFSVRGIVRFLLNRALRIYPRYWVSMIGTGIIAFLYPWMCWQIFHSTIFPKSPADVIMNIAIFGLNHNGLYRLLPQAWSLYVELSFYVLMALVLSRKKWITSVWFAASVVWTIYANMAGMSIVGRYYTLIAGSLPISSGALLYHYRDSLGRPGKWTIWVCGALYVASLAVSTIYDDLGICLYVWVLLGMITVASLKDLRPQRIMGFDKFFGDLSYPIYVSHAFVALLVLRAFWPNVPQHRGFDFFLMTYGYTIIFSYALHRFVELPVQYLRVKIKHRGISY